MKARKLTPEQVQRILPELLRDIPPQVLAGLVENVRAGNVVATVRVIPKRKARKEAHAIPDGKRLGAPTPHPR